MENKKIKALAAFLGADENMIKKSEYSELMFIADGEEYYVLTDEEADEQAAAYIEESLWAFNSDFIVETCGLDSAVDKESITKALRTMQERCCESCNALIKAIIEGSCGLEYFTGCAIQADGRGHFLSWYDGKENKHGDFYIYRVN